MKKLQLYRDGKPMLGTDGVMHVDGRFNACNVKLSVINRNKRYAKNLPHLVCDGFKYCDTRYKEISNLISL